MLISKPIALILLLLLPATAATIRAAENPVEAFRKEWQGRRVTVQRTLLTLVYNERGRFGKIAHGKREGLLNATPSRGIYYLFTGRRLVEDLTSSDPDRLFEMVKTSYQRDRNLDDGFLQVVTPLHIVQYIRGIELVVRRVEIEVSAVRLVLFKPESTEEMATTLTVQWPAPLSADLEERVEIERIIRQFLMAGPVGQP